MRYYGYVEGVDDHLLDQMMKRKGNVLMAYRKVKQYSILIALATLLFAVGNITYASYQAIPEPLFIPINDEVVYRENSNISIAVSYITNNRDTRRLNAIHFDNLDTMQDVNSNGYSYVFHIDNSTNDNPYNDVIGRYYTLKRGKIDIYLTKIDLNCIERNGSITFGSGTAMMDDGTMIPVDLGQITIYTQEYWDQVGLIEGSGGSNDHFDVDFKTGTPIEIKSLELDSFVPHHDAINMKLIVDGNKEYQYDDLKVNSNPMTVNKNLKAVFTSKEPNASIRWRFPMISIDMEYEKNGCAYNTWIYYPFYGTEMDEYDVEAYVEFWRAENE